ncbi:hypothetical protein GGS26DRAFT_586246 [Hypomontagnella submonticulosa]|nr:hypothetical protein GGS26DRAFT_586246 [Hypomontagnella submonticulosa]
MADTQGEPAADSAGSSANEPQGPNDHQDIAPPDLGPDETQCPMCWGLIPNSELTTLPCGHSFHPECIIHWSHVYEVGEFHYGRARCPMCRAWLTYNCDDILSKHLLRPGVTILEDEYTLNCPTFSASSFGGHTDRPEDRPWNPARYYIHFNQGNGMGDLENLAHVGSDSSSDVDGEQILQIIEHLESINLDLDANQPQGGNQEENAPEVEPQEEEPQEEDLDWDHPSGPTNTTQGSEDDQEVEAEHFLHPVEEPNIERPKAYVFSLVQYCADQGDVGSPLNGLNGLNAKRIDVADLFDGGHPEDMLIVINGLQREVEDFEEEWPNIPIILSPAAFTELRERHSNLHQRYELFRREHEGFIVLNDVARRYRDQKQQELGELLEEFWYAFR